MVVRALVGVVVGLTLAGITAVAFITVLHADPHPLVVGGAGMLGGLAAAWVW